MRKMLTSGLVFMPLEVFTNLDLKDLSIHMKEKVDNRFIEFDMEMLICGGAGIDKKTGYMCIEYGFYVDLDIPLPPFNSDRKVFNMWNFYKCKEPGE